MQDSANSTKSEGIITLTSKDERVLKFKFENMAGEFSAVLNKIKIHSIVNKQKDLYCYKSYLGQFTHKKVSEVVMGDFARLHIPKRYKEFTSITPLTKMPKVTFVAK